MGNGNSTNGESSTVSTLSQASTIEKLKPLFLGVGFVVIAAGAYFLTKDDATEHRNYENSSKVESATVSDSTTTQEGVSDIQKKAMQAMKSDLSLGGLDIGIDINKMRSLLGKEKSTKTDGKYQFFYYDNLEVGVKDGSVDALVSDSPQASTKRGIHPGSSLQDVIAAYGDNYLKSSYDKLILYEYKFLGVNNKEGLLRFAINQSDYNVNYISVRIPEDIAEKKKKVSSSQDSVQHPAIQVLYDFHGNITEKNFRQAYACLSKKMQNRMSYDGWVPGFKTTVSSTPSDVKIASASNDRVVLTYYLTAVDNPGGTQVFTGTAVLVNTEYGWKLDEITNKIK